MVRRHDDVVVVSPQGRLDPAWLTAASRNLPPAGAPVAVDLDDCIVVDPEVLLRFHRCVEAEPEDVCFVSARLTCRLLLARAGVTVRFPVFDRIEAALQARASAAAVGGTGWGAPTAGSGGDRPVHRASAERAPQR